MEAISKQRLLVLWGKEKKKSSVVHVSNPETEIAGIMLAKTLFFSFFTAKLVKFIAAQTQLPHTIHISR